MTQVVGPDGVAYEIVEPGSKDDPLLTDEARGSQPASGTDNPGAAGVAGTDAGEGAGTKPDATAVADPANMPLPGGVQEPIPTEPVAPVADDELALTAEEEAALERLGNFLEQAQEEARREVQGTADRRFNQYKDQSDTQIKALRDEVRQTQLQGLTDDQKKELEGRWNIEDKQRELDTYAATLDEQYKDIMVLMLVKDYGQYGVTEELLAKFDDPDEMEGFCKDQAIEFLRSGRQPEQGAKAAASAPAPTAAPAPPAPAGARAPVDVGGQPPPPEPKKLDEGMGPEAMARNFMNLPVQRVKVG